VPERLIVLDVDDTLYLERDYVRGGFASVAVWIEARFGACGFFDRAWAAFEAGRRGDIFNDTLTAIGIEFDAELISTLVTIYRSHTPSIKLLPDAAAFLSRYLGCCSIISDGPLLAQQNKIRSLGLEEKADPIMLTEALGDGYRKPSPRSFDLVQRARRVQASQCVYIADNPLKDFVGPKQLGWKTVRIRREGGLHFDRHSGDDVDVEIRSLDEPAPLPN
jgi:putative hydrolase of the HAD superfamily